MKSVRHEMRRMHRDGWTVREIAKHFNRAVSTTYNALRPLPDRTPRPKPTARTVISVVAAITNVKPEHIIAKGSRFPELVDARLVVTRILIQDFNYSQSDVSRAFGMHPSTVWAMTQKWEQPHLKELFDGAKQALQALTTSEHKTSCGASLIQCLSYR